MNKKTTRIGRIMFVMLSVTTFSASPLLAEVQKPLSQISLTGVGKISASPDIARVTSGVVSQAKTAAIALKDNTTRMTRIISGIKAAGIESRDIQTTGFSVNPAYSYNQKNRQTPPKIVGYKVQNQVHITVRKRDSLGGLLDTMIELGANHIHGVSFHIDNPQKLQDEARKRAFVDALRKAKIYSTAANNKLGRIITITENQTFQPRPQFAALARNVQEKSAVPIEAGEQTLSVQVNITWELK